MNWILKAWLSMRPQAPVSACGMILGHPSWSCYPAVIGPKKVKLFWLPGCFLPIGRKWILSFFIRLSIDRSDVELVCSPVPHPTTRSASTFTSALLLPGSILLQGIFCYSSWARYHLIMKILRLWASLPNVSVTFLLFQSLFKPIVGIQKVQIWRSSK